MEDNPHVHFDTQSNKWVFEDPDTGKEMEWDAVRNCWVEMVSEMTLSLEAPAKERH